MTILVELVLGMAEQARVRIGPSAAMGVLRVAIDRDPAAVDRRTLLLRAMGLALLSEDRASFEAFASRWAGSGGAREERRGLSLVARLVASERFEAARILADAEAHRFRSADAVFVLAAECDREGRRAEAEQLFAESAKIAASSGEPLGAARAEAELLRVSRSPLREREVMAAFEGASARAALRLAPAALASRGLYARVRVLDRLDELAGDPRHAPIAARIALRHTDHHGARLRPIERDRVIAILVRAQVDAALVTELRDGLAHPEPFRARARAALSGNLLGPAPKEGDERRDWLGLVALGAMARDEPLAASTPLEAIARGDASPIGWTAAVTALGHPRVRNEGLACVTAWIGSDVPPPRGYMSLANALERAGADELAARAIEEAAARSEDGARAKLAVTLEARAQAAYAAGQLEAARALLLEAIALS